MSTAVYTCRRSVWPTSNIWAGWPLQPFGPLFRGYYLLGLAFYTQALFWDA